MQALRRVPVGGLRRYAVPLVSSRSSAAPLMLMTRSFSSEATSGDEGGVPTSYTVTAAVVMAASAYFVRRRGRRRRKEEKKKERFSLFSITLCVISAV